MGRFLELRRIGRSAGTFESPEHASSPHGFNDPPTARPQSSAFKLSACRLIYFSHIADLERLDRELLAAVARLRPDWHLVIIGPVVKIDPATLRQAAYIHNLGGKPYGELPAYVTNWNVGVVPFARNAATGFKDRWQWSSAKAY